jgi:hypothetical protein
MNNPEPVTILAEDLRQTRFSRKYLKKRIPSLSQRAIYDAPMADGRGSGAQWVLDHYESEVLAHLIRRAKLPDRRRPEKWLIVVIDADKWTTQERLNEFRKRIAESKDERVRKCRVENDNVARLIPKWSIESWILNLNGEAADEDIPYKRQHRQWDGLIPTAAAELHAWVKSEEEPPNQCLSSLKLGILELRRLTA